MNEELTAAPERVVRFTTNLTGYVLVMRFKNEAAHNFRLEQTAPNGCQWVTIPTGEQNAAASFLLDNLRRKPVELIVTGPTEPFRDGERACRLREVGFGFGGVDQASPIPPQAFSVDVLISEETGGVERRVFVLDQAKRGPTDDCDQIVFAFDNQPQIESVLMQCFLGPRRFDFEIAEELGDHRCTIRSVRIIG